MDLGDGGQNVEGMDVFWRLGFHTVKQVVHWTTRLPHSYFLETQGKVVWPTRGGISLPAEASFEL